MKCRGVDWIVAHVMDASDGSIVVSLMPSTRADALALPLEARASSSVS